MRKLATIAATATAFVTCALALTGCGTASRAGGAPTLTLPASPVATVPTGTPAPAPTATPATPAVPPVVAATPTATPTPTGPMFATPEAAMRFLAVAFDTGDLSSLRQVTTPESRRELYDMWPGQVHLRLSGCQKDPGAASYVCSFPHDPPKGMAPGSVPVATMVVEPAARPGWYMSQIIECG